MAQVDHFVPGEQPDDEAIASRLRRPIPAGVTAAYVQAYTAPGETVLVPYCQSAAVAREIASLGRRALALNFDPLVVLLVRACLAPPSRRELDSAVTRLGNTLKQGVPLRHLLEEQFATTCPACLRPAVADYFIWERDPEAPLAKQLRCAACGWDGQALVDPADREKLAQVQAQSMHLHYLRDRVMPEGQPDTAPARMQALLKLYSPRSLYALAELTLKIEGLFEDGPLQDALKVLLLDCLDRCSSMAAAPGSPVQKRTVPRPARFLERNVWRTFEQAVARLVSSAGPPLPGLDQSVAAFLAPGAASPACVDQVPVRDLPGLLPARGLRLILFSPPPSDPAVWALSHFWGAWLLGWQAMAPLRPLLRQRQLDLDWYARVMAGSLRILAGLLKDDGRLVLVLTGQPSDQVEALLAAANRARLGVARLLQAGPDYRIEVTPTRPAQTFVAVQAPPSRPNEAERKPSWEAEVRDAAVDAALEIIRARAEPVAWSRLHGWVLWRLAERGLLAGPARPEGAEAPPLHQVFEPIRAALEHPGLVQLAEGDPDGGLWGAAGVRGEPSPLADRVEAEAYAVLRDSLMVRARSFEEAVCIRFPGPLTPDPALLAACLGSYAEEASPGFWRLRLEDTPDARQADRRQLLRELQDLGQRMGYGVATGPDFDVTWSVGSRLRAHFVVRWQAMLGDLAALSDRVRGATAYLVVPGGRSALVSYKLAHNPPLKQALEQAGWQFIKYRHVRELAAQAEVDEYSLRTIIGLDPIVERETTQLSLF